LNTEHWHENEDGEERLSQLRNRDLEITRISLGLQMRTRISRLEHEVKLLRQMEDSWILSRLSRVYFSATRLPRIVMSAVQKRLNK
jgi:hypothetical protein